jgi:hypothetical protein
MTAYSRGKLRALFIAQNVLFCPIPISYNEQILASNYARFTKLACFLRFSGDYKMKRFNLLLVVLGVCILAGNVSAGTIGNWKTGAVGLWSNGANWSTPNGSVPPTGSTSTTDEIKITGSYSDCTVDFALDNGVAKISVCGTNDATAPVVRIVPNAVWGAGDFRVGPKGATSGSAKGVVIQTGGSLSVNYLKLGVYSTSGAGVADGTYTISNGTLQAKTTGTGYMYVGAGITTGSTISNTVGKFTIDGSAPSITMKKLYVASDGTNVGTGTLEFKIGDSGVSKIHVTDASGTMIDGGGGGGVANLVVSFTGSAIPDGNIVLIENTNTGAVSGTFDTINGGSAAEGAQITLAGNTYSLTYQYATNDIALIFVGSAVIHHKAYTPAPADGATVDTTLALLDWINADPNIPENPVYCDVYLGTEPNRLSMDKVTLGNNISQVNINTTNFPTYGNLQDETQYYWAVDVHDGSILRSGDIWSFLVSHNTAPVVNAGPDQVSWLGKSSTPGQEVIALDGTTSDDGNYTVLWTQVANGAPTVTITPNNVDDTSVTVTARGTYVFMLTADDGDLQTSDTVQIIVGSTACDASHMSTGAVYDAEDQNHDCIVDLADFAVLITDDWLTCTDKLTNCGN